MAPSWGEDTGAEAGLGFCNLSLSQSVPQAWLGEGEKAVFQPIGPQLSGDVLSEEPYFAQGARPGWWPGAVGQREASPLISWVPGEGRGTWVSPADLSW